MTRLAGYFGATKTSVLWRLFNLRLISAKLRDSLFEEDAKGYGKQLAELTGGLEAESKPPLRPRLAPADERLLSLAIEAAQAEEISRSRLTELLGLAGLAEDEIYSIPLARREGT